MIKEQALDFFTNNDLLSLGLQADAVRKQLHPNRIVSYSVASERRSNGAEGLALLALARDGDIEQHLGKMAKLQEKQEANPEFHSFALTTEQYPEITAAEYLKFLAISRIYLDSIPHLEIPAAALDTKLAQVALRFGADDLGLVPLSTNPSAKDVTEERVRQLIYDAGFIPKQRALDFQAYYLR